MDSPSGLPDGLSKNLPSEKIPSSFQLAVHAHELLRHQAPRHRPYKWAEAMASSTALRLLRYLASIACSQASFKPTPFFRSSTPHSLSRSGGLPFSMTASCPPVLREQSCRPAKPLWYRPFQLGRAAKSPRSLSRWCPCRRPFRFADNHSAGGAARKTLRRAVRAGSHRSHAGHPHKPWWLPCRGSWPCRKSRPDSAGHCDADSRLNWSVSRPAP